MSQAKEQEYVDALGILLLQVEEAHLETLQEGFLIDLRGGGARGKLQGASGLAVPSRRVH